MSEVLYQALVRDFNRSLTVQATSQVVRNSGDLTSLGRHSWQLKAFHLFISLACYEQLVKPFVYPYLKHETLEPWTELVDDVLKTMIFFLVFFALQGHALSLLNTILVLIGELFYNLWLYPNYVKPFTEAYQESHPYVALCLEDCIEGAFLFGLVEPVAIGGKFNRSWMMSTASYLLGVVVYNLAVAAVVPGQQPPSLNSKTTHS